MDYQSKLIEMNLPTININRELYHEFVNGLEVMIDANAGLSPGDHVLVYKNTIAAESSVAVPHVTQQSDSIGVEGVVLRNDDSASSRLLCIRKI